MHPLRPKGSLDKRAKVASRIGFDSAPRASALASISLPFEAWGPGTPLRPYPSFQIAYSETILDQSFFPPNLA
jgi:hypothetical protein